ncbi:NAD(P)H-dependent oxidoreductase [Paenibacillus sp. GCM10012307]|uniref:FMN dependent NADH:quinone oxidoreductase n=1 Tax=Paenibacillus roseus TaxID=2798579 RepID=A0A934MMJ8_9BACL|nr:NAD(P)H-dependent oxidoreductase [Paenibacillus roseus]MBJ6360011.1 NAD(P)H-dependent oxidoreductase [Paenibacillus roseus]
MTTVLYITANPGNEETSYSLGVGQEFVKTYQSANPEDEVIHLDLFKMGIPQLDSDIFSGWGKMSTGMPFNELTDIEKEKISRLAELVDQFIAADKYVFVNPIWNFSFPTVMKAYLDALCVAGKTFRYVSGKGRVGLLQDKKAIHIQASGSVLSQGSAYADWEMGHRHLSVIMEFFGISEFEGIFVEGTAAAPEQARKIKEDAVQKAHKIASSF